MLKIPDEASLGRASKAGAALGMPVAAAVVSARVLAELEGFVGCHPDSPCLMDPSATLAATCPYRAPMSTCETAARQLRAQADINSLVSLPVLHDSNASTQKAAWPFRLPKVIFEQGAHQRMVYCLTLHGRI